MLMSLKNLILWFAIGAAAKKLIIRHGKMIFLARLFICVFLLVILLKQQQQLYFHFCSHLINCKKRLFMVKSLFPFSRILQQFFELFEFDRIECEWCVPCLKIHLPNFFVAKFASSFSLLSFNPQLNFFSSPLSLLHSLPLFLRHKFCVLAFRHLNSLLALRNIAFLLLSIETTFWLFYATTKKKKMKECTWQHLAMIKCRDNRCLLIGLSSYLFSLCFLLDELACSCKSF